MPGGDDDETFTNILTNAIQPVDVRHGSQVAGAAEYVAAEVLVSYFARYLFKAQRRTLMELAAIHTVSILLIGGLSAGVDPSNIYGYESPWGDLIQDGAKGVPAVFAAQYICNTALAGLHAPKLQFADILMTAATKIITRPLVALVFPYLGVTFRNNLDVLEELFNNKQRAVSRLVAEPSESDLRR